MAPTPPLTIPVLLLKTRSHPHDAYEEYFSKAPSGGTRTRTTTSEDEDDDETAEASFSFVPQFVPVLEHRPNAQNLDILEQALEKGTLGQNYGGMIFTSQRAVEAWAEVVKRTEKRRPSAQRDTTEVDVSGRGQHHATQPVTTEKVIDMIDPPPRAKEPRLARDSEHVENNATENAQAAEHMVDNASSFPLYTVGPATSRALNTLVEESTMITTMASPFARLRPSVLGEHTGTGGNLAEYILSHYNGLEDQAIHTLDEASRLPFTSTSGSVPESDNSGRAEDEEGPRKKGLLFLVGEQRRDIIPRTLTDVEGRLNPQQRIAVDEVEVYATDVMGSFQNDFETRVDSAKTEGHKVVVVVVFSPQGCECMLRSLGFIDQANNLTQTAVNRWSNTTSTAARGHQQQTYIVVTIGPTTRDHLKNTFGFEADVCAAKPSPQGVGEGLKAFLRGKGLI